MDIQLVSYLYTYTHFSHKCDLYSFKLLSLSYFTMMITTITGMFMSIAIPFEQRI